VGELFRLEKPRQSLAFSGERFTTEAGGQIETEHLHRYLLAREFCRGKDVLDVASGEGYGAAILAKVARSTIGVEIDPPAATHAHQSYSRSNLRFVCGDARQLPLADASVDVVVSFETLEHFAEHDEFLLEVKRVLRPNGIVVISTPDRDVYSPVGRPANPFHVRELTAEQFRSALGRVFVEHAVYVQRPLAGSVIMPSESGRCDGAILSFEKRDPDHIEADSGLPRAVYLIAFASAQPVPNVFSTSLYVSDSSLEQPDAQQRQDHTTLQIFSGGHGGYSEELSLRKAFRLGVWENLFFDIPAAISGQIRIDPADRPGIAEVSRIALTTDTGDLVWSSEASGAVQELKAAGTAMIIPHSDGLLLLSTGPDPQVLVPQLTHKGARLHVEISLRFDQNPHAMSEAVNQHITRRIETLAQNHYRELEAKQKELVYCNERISQISIQLRASESERMLTLADYKQVLAERNDLRREVGVIEAALAGTGQQQKAELERLQRELSVHQINLHSMEDQLRSEQQINAAVLRSVSWRVTRPCRTVMAFARKLLRR